MQASKLERRVQSSSIRVRQMFRGRHDSFKNYFENSSQYSFQSCFRNEKYNSIFKIVLQNSFI